MLSIDFLASNLDLNVVPHNGDFLYLWAGGGEVLPHPIPLGKILKSS